MSAWPVNDSLYVPFILPMPCQTTMLQSDAGQPLASMGGWPRWLPKSLGRRADFIASANIRSVDQSSTPLRLTPIRLAAGTSRPSSVSQRRGVRFRTRFGRGETAEATAERRLDHRARRGIVPPPERARRLAG